MADYNRNRRNQSSEDNWDQNRDSFNRNDEHSNYGGAGYGGGNYTQNRSKQDSEERGYRHDSAHGRELENQGGYGSGYNQNLGANYGHVNYIPDNDDNRFQNRGYENKQQGNFGQDYNSGGYNRLGNSGSFGNSNYGHEQSRGDWNQGRMNTGGSGGEDHRNSGGYSSGYSGGNYGSGNPYDSYQNRQNTGYGQEGRYGHQNWQRTSEQRNVYGGDTSNYGNANQGGWNRDRDRDWWDRTKDRVASWFGDDDAERRMRQERQYSGGHRGKGPKDYQRSADRIREDICDRLYEDDYVDASNIDIKIEGNEVILSGTVRSKEEKRRAEDLVESISGVRNVENRIRVDRGDSSSTMHQYTGNTDRPGGIGDESGTTNEIIRNEGRNKSKNQ